MGVREKMKKAFGGKKSGDNSPSDAGTPKIPGVEYYKPGEIPRPKYRGKWDQEHQDKLHAFSFTAAFRSRRGSGYSTYSPSGLKAQSRRASHISKKSKSDADDKSLRQKSTNPGRVKEDEDDKGDVANVGLSRPATAGGQAENKGLTTGANTDELHLAETARQDDGNTIGDIPFTAEELTRKLTAAKLTAAKLEDRE